MLFGCVLGTLAGYNTILYNLALRFHGNDVGKFCYATQGWLAGASLYAPNLATHMQVGRDGLQEFTNMNSPHFHVFVLLFAYLPLGFALLTWTVLNLVAGAVAGALILREISLRKRPEDMLLVSAGVLGCGATGAVFVTGQHTGVLLLSIAVTCPLCKAWRCHGRSRGAIVVGLTGA